MTREDRLRANLVKQQAAIAQNGEFTDGGATRGRRWT